jgi:hypothetical protein
MKDLAGMDEAALERWLSLCRTEDERRRVREQWQQMQAKQQSEHQAALDTRRAQAEQLFRQIVRKHYPFTDVSFEADWPVLRARLAAELIARRVIEDWEAAQANP